MDADADAYADRYARFSGGVGGAFSRSAEEWLNTADGGVRQRTGGVAVARHCPRTGAALRAHLLRTCGQPVGSARRPAYALGEALPMLLARAERPQLRRSQDLLPVLSTSEAGVDYWTLLAGVTYGAVRSDFLGRLHVLLVERPEINPLSVTVLYQPQPGGEFAALWRSREDPLWSMRRPAASYRCRNPPRACCPISSIGCRWRDRRPAQAFGRAGCVCGAPPFARQWAATLWRFVSIEEALESGVVRPGYNWRTRSWCRRR